jgi:hypothetical protein
MIQGFGFLTLGHGHASTRRLSPTEAKSPPFALSATTKPVYPSGQFAAFLQELLALPEEDLLASLRHKKRLALQKGHYFLKMGAQKSTGSTNS